MIATPHFYAWNDRIEDFLKRRKAAFEAIKEKKFRTKDNSITLVSSVKDKEILLLDNIDFENKGELIMNINPNTTDDSIIRINNKDKYDSSEFMIYMKDKGYKCR